MKKFLLLFAFALTTTLSFSQDISDVSQSGNTLTVRDEKNNYITSKGISSSDKLCGFSSMIIVIKSGSTVTVYDQKFNYISSKGISSSDIVKNVSGNNILIKSGNTVTTYDKKFNYISSRFE
jgi:hypothetical protein